MPCLLPHYFRFFFSCRHAIAARCWLRRYFARYAWCWYFVILALLCPASLIRCCHVIAYYAAIDVATTILLSRYGWCPCLLLYIRLMFMICCQRYFYVIFYAMILRHVCHAYLLLSFASFMLLDMPADIAAPWLYDALPWYMPPPPDMMSPTFDAIITRVAPVYIFWCLPTSAEPDTRFMSAISMFMLCVCCCLIFSFIWYTFVDGYIMMPQHFFFFYVERRCASLRAAAMPLICYRYCFLRHVLRCRALTPGYYTRCHAMLILLVYAAMRADYASLPAVISSIMLLPATFATLFWRCAFDALLLLLPFFWCRLICHYYFACLFRRWCFDYAPYAHIFAPERYSYLFYTPLWLRGDALLIDSRAVLLLSGVCCYRCHDAFMLYADTSVTAKSILCVAICHCYCLLFIILPCYIHVSCSFIIIACLPRRPAAMPRLIFAMPCFITPLFYLCFMLMHAYVCFTLIIITLFRHPAYADYMPPPLCRAWFDAWSYWWYRLFADVDFQHYTRYVLREKSAMIFDDSMRAWLFAMLDAFCRLFFFFLLFTLFFTRAPAMRRHMLVCYCHADILFPVVLRLFPWYDFRYFRWYTRYYVLPLITIYCFSFDMFWCYHFLFSRWRYIAPADVTYFFHAALCYFFPFHIFTPLLDISMLHTDYYADAYADYLICRSYFLIILCRLPWCCHAMLFCFICLRCSAIYIHAVIRCYSAPASMSCFAAMPLSIYYLACRRHMFMLIIFCFCLRWFFLFSPCRCWYIRLCLYAIMICLIFIFALLCPVYLYWCLLLTCRAMPDVDVYWCLRACPRATISFDIFAFSPCLRRCLPWYDMPILWCFDLHFDMMPALFHACMPDAPCLSLFSYLFAVRFLLFWRRYAMMPFSLIFATRYSFHYYADTFIKMLMLCYLPPRYLYAYATYFHYLLMMFYYFAYLLIFLCLIDAWCLCFSAAVIAVAVIFSLLLSLFSLLIVSLALILLRYACHYFVFADFRHCWLLFCWCLFFFFFAFTLFRHTSIFSLFLLRYFYASFHYWRCWLLFFIRFFATIWYFDIIISMIAFIRWCCLLASPLRSFWYFVCLLMFRFHDGFFRHAYLLVFACSYLPILCLFITLIVYFYMTLISSAILSIILSLRRYAWCDYLASDMLIYPGGKIRRLFFHFADAAAVALSPVRCIDISIFYADIFWLFFCYMMSSASVVYSAWFRRYMPLLCLPRRPQDTLLLLRYWY